MARWWREENGCRWYTVLGIWCILGTRDGRKQDGCSLLHTHMTFSVEYLSWRVLTFCTKTRSQWFLIPPVLGRLCLLDFGRVVGPFLLGPTKQYYHYIHIFHSVESVAIVTYPLSLRSSQNMQVGIAPSMNQRQRTWAGGINMWLNFICIKISKKKKPR